MRSIHSTLVTLAIAAATLTSAAPVWAENFTTTAEVKPILTATKPQWIAVREYDGKDLLYFTNLLAWRCALTAVSYGVNGAAAETPLVMEPCYETEPTPNALKMDQGVLPYIEAGLGSIATVSVAITWDDGTTDQAEYVRADVMTP